MQLRGDLTPVVLVKKAIMDRIKIIAILAILSFLFLFSFNADGKSNYEDTDSNTNSGTSVIPKTQFRSSSRENLTGKSVMGIIKDNGF